MDNLGFKKLTIDNWLEPDTVMKIFAQIDSNGNSTEIGKEEWLQNILEIQLSGTVPEEIKKLFEVSKSTMSYGYFFYPIYTLASEQLFRVLETAVSYKCETMGAPTKAMKKYQLQIDYLIENSIIPQFEKDRWHAARRLRNSFSHPKAQTIITPMDALSNLRKVSQGINLIFDNKEFKNVNSSTRL